MLQLARYGVPVKALTQAEFAAVQDKLDAALRATKRGSQERAAVESILTIWEAAIAQPQATKAQRDARHTEIARAAALVHSVIP